MAMIPLIREAYETIDCAAARLFAQECGIEHPTKFYKNLIKVFVPNLGVAKALLKSKFKLLSVKCAEWGQDKVKLVPLNVLDDSQTITIHAHGTSSSSGVLPMTNVITAMKNGRPNLIDASRRQVLDFIIEQREAGKIVVVTSQITNRCVDVDLISPERGIFAYASQWHGLNFMELWRESLEQYFQLLSRLESDGYIPGFVYELLRIDGSKGRYIKDYYLANNFLRNEPVRISVSNTNDWELVRPVAV